ncbi:MAG: lamin tail domain-containing protein [Verrucomicrobiales bacterium]
MQSSPGLSHSLRSVLALAAGVVCAGAVGGSTAPVISEFMTANDGPLYDEDGDSSDWIEILNPGSAPVDLGGMYLTDEAGNLTKWRLPAMTVPSGGFQIVFASNKDRDVGEPHTNFRLSSVAGGYLALVAADGTTVVSQFTNYPVQFDGFSYGLAIEGAGGSNAVLVTEGDACSLLVPTADLGLNWTLPAFNDGLWLEATTGIGFERSSGYQNLFGPGGDILDLASDINASAYCRIPFAVASTDGLTRLLLRVKADDGFIAYLNGVRVAATNAPADPQWESSATADRPDPQALQFIETDLTAQAGLLTAGENVLAIHALNSSAGSSDMLLLPRLEAEFSTAGGVTLGAAGYFQSPTPGTGPVGPQGLPAPAVVVSEPGRGFVDSLQVSLSTSSPAAQIRYTLDGSLPTATSLLYQGAPLTFSATTLLRARTYQAALTPGPLTEVAYIRLSPNMQSFSSNLPVVIMNRIGTGTSAANGKTYAFFAFFEPAPATGRTTLNRPYTLGTRGGWKVRGSSSAGFPKQAFSVEAWDATNLNKDIAPLGLPEESDWVFHAQSVFDRTLMRNSYIYDLSNQVGRYATRTQFFELFKDDNAGDLNYSSDYWGVYDLTEKISRDENRVDVERLQPGAATAPAITGGYMFKVDRLDPGDGGLNAGGQSLGWVYPKEAETTPAQVDYARTFINEMVAALPTSRRAEYIDELSWIDHHLLNVLTLNADALRLSTYFFKRRGRPIEFGPIWDFDRSAGSTDGRDADPSTWQGGTAYFDYPWWDTLFDDGDFWQAYIDRYFQLRTGPFATAKVHALIDGMAARLMEAQVRNFQRWSDQPRFGGYQGEVNHLKSWLGTRLSWMDGQFAPRPAANLAAGPHPAGTTVQLTAALRAGQKIYYTLDGSDPRPPFVPPTIDGTTLVTESTTVRAWAPTSDIGTAWRTNLTFDDTAWLTGQNGVGYERSSGYEPYINIDVNTAMQAITSCYIRVKFQVDETDLADWNFLTLAARYDDGFVAYLNGTQIMADRAPSPAAWNAAATQTHDDGSAANFQSFDLSPHLSRLRVGENLLAIHALNESLTSSDFLHQVRLIAGQRSTPPGGGIRGIEYTGPIVLNQTARLVARVYDSTGGNDPNSGRTPVGTGWSAPLRLEYLVNESPAAAGSLVISEVFADPYDFANAADRQIYEWIELQNVSNAPVSLTGAAFTAGITFTFPGASLPAGGRAVVVRDRDAFERLYGPDRTELVLGSFGGALDNAGETITLAAADGSLIQSLTYSESQARPGYSLVTTATGLRESRFLLGSPGATEPTPIERPGVVINEVMTNPVAPELARLEIFNPSSEPVDLTGWFFTDDLESPHSMHLPSSLVLPGGGYAVLTSTDFFDWTAQPSGGEAYLVAATPDGSWGDYVQGFTFEASAAGIPFGRHVVSTGSVHHVPMAAATFGQANGEPRGGPLVISELMYHPPDGQAEYLELHNRGSAPIPLSQVAIAGTGFAFNATAPELPVGGLALVVSSDPAAFRVAHVVPDSVPVFGPMPSALSNGGERLRVLRAESGGQSNPILQVAVDTVEYSDNPPWPIEADGQGSSLHRTGSGYGGDPLHWSAATPTPGFIGNAPTDWRSLFFSPAELANPALSGPLADADADGLSNLLEYLMGSHPRNPDSAAQAQLTLTAANTLVITFTLRDGTTGFLTSLEQSSNLRDWQPATAFTLTSTTPNGDGSSTVVFKGPPSAANQYFRVAARPEVEP